MADRNLYKRLARAEAMANAQRAELMETLKAAYDRACQEENAGDAAEFARKIRNRLLEQSDAEMALDRLGLEVPAGTTFAAWLVFLKGLAEVITGRWAQYRQALRDLPQQPGFPFDIAFPTPPEEVT